ncbi:MAG: hypothetical protein N2257_04150 [Thermodesulfovibrionales bacterium]|nr:hypothetical protein [Thermodesulfovibrionales bacterium]
MNISENPSLNIRYYWFQILRRKKFFIIIFLVILSIFTWGSFLMPVEYEASSTFLVENTLFESTFLRGSRVLNVDSKLSMIKEGLFSEELVRNSLKKIYPASNKNLIEDRIVSETKSRLKININTIGERNIFQVKVFFRHKDPIYAADFVNTLIRDYIEYLNTIRKNTISGITEFSQKKLLEYEQKLDQINKLIQDFLNRNPNFVPERESPLLRGFEALHASRIELEIKLKELEATRESLAKQLTDAHSVAYRGTEIEESPFMRLSRLNNQLLNLSARYTDNHPDVIKTRMEIEELKKQIDHMKKYPDNSENPVIYSINEEIKKIESEIERVKTQISEISGQQIVAEEKLKKLSRERQEWLNLQREKSVYQKLYDDLFQKIEAAQLELVGIPKSILIAEYAKVPHYPKKPDRSSLILAGFLIGLSLASGIVIALFYISGRFNDENEIESELRLPVLSVIPEIIPDSYFSKTRENRILLASGVYLLLIFFVWLNEILFKYLGFRIINF